jgi:hypothetical protein
MPGNWIGIGSDGGRPLAIAVGLIHLGIPKEDAIRYESAIIADKFLLIANGTSEELARARLILGIPSTRWRMHWVGSATVVSNGCSRTKATAGDGSDDRLFAAVPFDGATFEFPANLLRRQLQVAITTTNPSNQNMLMYLFE